MGVHHIDCSQHSVCRGLAALHATDVLQTNFFVNNQAEKLPWLQVNVLKSLDHPNIIRIFEAFERRGHAAEP